MSGDREAMRSLLPPRRLTRREFGVTAGAIVATFMLAPASGRAQVVEGPPPASFAKAGRLEGWIAIGHDNVATVFTGKAELGQGILTALAQIAAEEMDLGMDQIRMVSARTTRSPDEGYTFGSQSVEQSGSAIRLASAYARSLLIAAAAERLKVAPDSLTVERGVVRAADGRELRYGDIARDAPELLRREVSTRVRAKRPGAYRIVGKSVPRIDLADKVLAKSAFLQDMRMPDMLFGRVVRPPSADAALLGIDEDAVRSMPGVVAIVRLSSFLGVVAEREEQAIQAADALRHSARWQAAKRELPDEAALPGALEELAREDIVLKDPSGAKDDAVVARWVEASYSRPYLSHASIGPSCAVAVLKEGRMTVWSHTQGVYPLRGDMAVVLGMAVDDVEVIHVQAAGCYGHNGADDAALDAALLAQAIPGRPVKLQWMRQDEFGWAPAAPAMRMKARAGLSEQGRIVDWNYELWSNSHATRPGQAGGTNLLAAWYLDKGHHISPPAKIPQPFGNGDRNAVPLYTLPRQRVVHHLLIEMPLRTGSLRTLGGHGNIHAIECFMDELALAAGADPVAFRLDHLADPRGRAVLQAAADAAGWTTRPLPPDGRHGRGVAYTRYKNISTYAAVVVDVEVDRDSGAIRIMRAVAAVDAGLVINPDGVVSQSEGGIIQGLSWALKEQLRFDRKAITSLDWSGYPIMGFDEVPPIEVVLLDRPDDPSLGAGEATVGPASAALANAVSHALGKPVRDLPLTAERVKAALRMA
jgi:CO/xanthine dehydrogenase Mo-binding subunit